VTCHKKMAHVIIGFYRVHSNAYCGSRRGKKTKRRKLRWRHSTSLLKWSLITVEGEAVITQNETHGSRDNISPSTVAVDNGLACISYGRLHVSVALAILHPPGSLSRPPQGFCETRASRAIVQKVTSFCIPTWFDCSFWRAHLHPVKPPHWDVKGLIHTITAMAFPVLLVCQQCRSCSCLSLWDTSLGDVYFDLAFVKHSLHGVLSISGQEEVTQYIHKP